MKDYHSMSADQMSAELREMAELAPTPDLQECYQRAAALLGGAQGARKAPKINHEAWSKSLIGFIRSKGLERELTDWCGGWKCPIQSSDGGGEVRPANTANMPGSVPGEEVSSSAGGIERTTVRETALTSCAGVTPGPSEALSGTSLARWCYENPNLAARTIEGLRALSEGDRS